MRYLGFLLIISLMFNGCKPDEDQPMASSEMVKINYNYVWGDEVVDFNKSWHITENGDSFQPTLFKFYLHELTFKGSDNETKNQSYFQIDATIETDNSIQLELPHGEYSNLSFTIGVRDSLTNLNGMLNEQFISPMYWGMLNGYINMKMEGKSPQVPDDGTVLLHIGGYQGEYMLSRDIDITLGTPLTVTDGSSELTITVDLANYFGGENIIDVADVNLIHMPNDDAVLIADNWKTMFSVK